MQNNLELSHIRLICLVCLSFISDRLPAAEISVVGFTSRIARDYSGDGVFTEFTTPTRFDSLSVRRFDFVGNPETPKDERSLIEFDVSDLNLDSLATVDFDFRIIGFTSSTLGVNIVGYASDGSPNTSDAARAGSVLGSYNPNDTGLGATSVTLDVGEVSSLLAQNTGFLGLRLEGMEPTNTQIANIGSPFDSPPTLRFSSETPPINTDPIVDQDYSVNQSVGGILAFSETVNAQTFTPSRSGILTEVGLELGRREGAVEDNLLIQIRPVNNGIPDLNQVLAERMVPISDLPILGPGSNLPLTNVDFADSGVNTVAGEPLALSVTRQSDSRDTRPFWNWGLPGYSSGDPFMSAFGRPFEVGSNQFDFGFRTVVAALGPTNDLNSDGVVSFEDLEFLRQQIVDGRNDDKFDIDQDGQVDENDIVTFVSSPDTLHSYVGDVNEDGEFNTRDFVAVFTVSKFEKDEPANWYEGDWNADNRFSTADLVLAFREDGYEKGKRIAVIPVPEPNFVTILVVVALLLHNRLLKLQYQPA